MHLGVLLHIAHLPLSLADFKDCLSAVYSAIDEADFLAIDGEFSGNYKGTFEPPFLKRTGATQILIAVLFVIFQRYKRWA